MIELNSLDGTWKWRIPGDTDTGNNSPVKDLTLLIQSNKISAKEFRDVHIIITVRVRNKNNEWLIMPRSPRHWLVWISLHYWKHLCYIEWIRGFACDRSMIIFLKLNDFWRKWSRRWSHLTGSMSHSCSRGKNGGMCAILSYQHLRFTIQPHNRYSVFPACVSTHFHIL